MKFGTFPARHTPAAQAPVQAHTGKRLQRSMHGENHLHAGTEAKAVLLFVRRASVVDVKLLGETVFLHPITHVQGLLCTLCLSKPKLVTTTCTQNGSQGQSQIAANCLGLYGECRIHGCRVLFVCLHILAPSFIQKISTPPLDQIISNENQNRVKQCKNKLQSKTFKISGRTAPG